VDTSTAREVLKIIGPKDLPSALKLVAEKLWERRRRDSSYRRRVDFGFVLTVLRQDWIGAPSLAGRTSIPATAVEKQDGASVAPSPPIAVSGPPRYREPTGARRNESRDRFRRAGDILRSSGIFERLDEP
jgi:hypothetical protein